jgi:transcriptional regulator with XRE-family HTH domain
MDIVKLLGSNLRKIRVLRQLTQEEFSEVLDIHLNYYSSLERGHRNPTLKMICKLASKLKCDPLELLK